MNGTESKVKAPAPADLQRWSEELARNPGSLTFLPLARAYRKQRRLDLALKLCLGGLEQHPTHVEGHALLALLYLESGDRAKAADEWATVLRLKPGNFEALRGMGFRYLEEGDAAKARQHLERAALIRPDDAVVQEALRLLRQRHDEPMSVKEPAEPAAEPRRTITEPPRADRFAFERPAPEPPETVGAAPSAAAAPAAEDEPWIAAEPSAPPPPARAAPAAGGGRAAAAARDTPAKERRPTPDAAGMSEPAAADPATLFEPILNEPPALGVLLLDRRGIRLAGGLKANGRASADDVGALLGNAVEEAVRTATHLELGVWRMLRIEAAEAIVHVVPSGGDALIVVAARRDTPLGWLKRSAGIAATVAARYLEGAHGQ